MDPTIPDPDKSIIKNLLTKPFNPYVLRHSSLTEKSTMLTESVLRSHAGWSADSSMPKVYIHLRDESSKILLEKRGILSKKDKETTTITKTKICVNCQEPNRPDAQWCISCKMILSYSYYKETLEKQSAKDDEIANMKEVMKKVMDGVDNLKKDLINKKSLVMSAEIYNNVHKMMDQMKEDYKINIEQIKEDYKIISKLLQKRDEIMLKKGFVTKEDEDSIETSVMDSIKESDPNVWKTLMLTRSKMTTK